MSDIARADTAFLFSVAGDPDTDHDWLPDAWIQAYFGNLNQTGTWDFDSAGTSNLAEFILGLDPTKVAARISAEVAGAAIQWQGKAGRNFVVQRSATLTEAWAVVSTQTEVEGTNSFIDPSPSAGKAFYRVLLVIR